MKRVVLTFIVLSVAVAAFAGGSGEATPQVDVGTEDIAYISPESSAGVQDALTVPITVATAEGRNNDVITAYRLEVRDASDNVVWVESAVDETEQPGFFGRLMENLGLRQRETTVTIPESTTWDGTFQGSDQGADGSPVPDGTYTYTLTATDSRDVTATSEPREVVVDNTPPTATASVDFDVFSPNGDDQRDTVTLTQETSSETTWTGTITSAGETIFEVTWSGAADESFTWDGRNLAATEVDDGDYVYTLTATDEAGNTGSIDPITVTVDTAERPLSIAASTPAFSPNGDGSKDTVTLTFGSPSLLRLESAVISVTDEAGNRVGSVEVGGMIGDEVVLNGYLDQGMTRRAPEGVYSVSVTARYGNGTVVESGPIDVEVDVTAPSGSVSVTESVFSPEGDGLKDTITIRHNLSDDASWTGYVYVAGGEVLETLQLGSNVPETVVWDGRDLDGNPIPDGTYSYSLIGVDAAGNQYETSPIRIGIDRRETTVDLAVDREYFSPNGDGQGDVVVVSPQLSVPTGIESYEVELLNASGERLATLRGTGNPPREFPWDGTGPDGQTLPEGGYVGVLDLVYEKGNQVQAVTPLVTIDNTIPQVSLRASSSRITPNGDGIDEQISFIPFVDPVLEIVRFTGQIQSLNGTVVAEVRGAQPIGSAFWNGTNSRGQTAPDGAYIASLEVEHRNGTIRRAQTGTIALGTIDDSEPPAVALRFTPQTFSPDGDGIDDTVTATLSVQDASGVSAWAVTVRDPDGGVFFEYASDDPIIRTFEWDGINDAGERVEMATDYVVEYEVTDAMGNVATGSEILTVDVLTVERFGMRKIDLPDIIFEGYTTRYLNWNKDLSEQNVQVLDRIAAMLEKFPDYEIELHGHAVSVLYYDAELSDLEQVQTLIPLSEGRSATILDAMQTRGIDTDRFTREWWGKLRPLVPFSDLDGRFVNRRVEFYLVR
jgi:flagellar hook assembly protein FlgD